jgi:uracil-DNA glycosylase family 4
MQRLFPKNNFVPHKEGRGLRLVIAEAPGQEEAACGEPLVGSAGGWFNAMLPKANLNRDDLTIINCINCQPPDNIFPTDGQYLSKAEAYQAVEHCKNAHVLPVLKSRVWRRVDLLGAKPLYFYGGKSDGIGKWRGSPIPLPDLDSQKPLAIATLHPAYIARDQNMLPVVINDLRKDLSVPPEYYNLYPTVEDVQNFKAKVFAFDIETPQYKTLGKAAPISIVGLCAENYKSLIVPFQGQYVDELKRIFREAEAVVGHNCIQFDIPRLERDDVRLSNSCVVWDTMLLHHLRFPNLGGEDKTGGGHDLGFVGSQFTNKPAWKDDKLSYELYCARDTDVTWQIYQDLVPLLKQHNLLDLYHNVQVPLAKICHLMSETGITVDASQIGKVREQVERQMADLELALPEHIRSVSVPKRKRQPAPRGYKSPVSGKPVKFIYTEVTEWKRPWRSGMVVAKWWDEIGLPVQFDPKTENPTTGKMAVAKLVGYCLKKAKPAMPEVARSLQALGKLRKLNSLLTTFCKVDMQTSGKIHCNFKPHGTASGRLSSSDPNLQNIPEDARYIYVPSQEGWSIIDVDYSQIESRLTAWFAKDQHKLKMLAVPGWSEHKHNAATFFDIPYEEVVKDNDKDAPYGKAKRITHGVNYGMGAKKICMLYDLDFKEVKRLVEIWRRENYCVYQWQNQTSDLGKRQGYLTTPFGRKRWFYTSSAYTESLSFLPQSTAADIIFRSMLGLMWQRIGMTAAPSNVKIVEPLPEPARLLLQVHDSLVFECPNDKVAEVVAVIKRVMEQPWPELGGFHIPIGVKVGPSWGLAEDYKA